MAWPGVSLCAGCWQDPQMGWILSPTRAGIVRVGCACLRFRSVPCKFVIQDPNAGSIKDLPDPHRAGLKPSGAGW